LNVGAIIVEQLDWDGRLKTLVFKPCAQPNFWVALLDEYGEDSAGPFHILDPGHEREFGEQMESQPARPGTWLSARTRSTNLCCSTKPSGRGIAKARRETFSSLPATS